MRVVLAVIVAFVVMAIFIFALSIAPWFMYGLDEVLEPGRFDTTTLITAYSIAISFLGALLGGFIARAIGRRIIGVVILAVLSLTAGMANAVGQMYKPEPGPRERNIPIMEAVSERREPSWYTLLVPLLGVAGVMIGGRGKGSISEQNEN